MDFETVKREMLIRQRVAAENSDEDRELKKAKRDGR